MISVYEELSSYFKKIEHDTFINASFFSNDMISLEFSSQVLFLLNKYNLSLPISCYHGEIGEGERNTLNGQDIQRKG